MLADFRLTKPIFVKIISFLMYVQKTYCSIKHKLALQKIAILILFLTQTLLLYSQERYRQIERQLPGMKDDTVKVNRLIELGEHYCSIENNNAMMFLQDAYSISISLDYTRGIGRSLLWLGRVYYYESQFNLSNRYLDKAKKPLEKDGDRKTLAFWYLVKSFSLRATSDYVQAIEMLKKAVELLGKTGERKQLSTCYYCIGEILLDRGEIKKAMEYFNESLSIKKEINDKFGIANVYSCIGSAYISLGVPDSSLLYFRQALSIRTEMKNQRHIASSELSIGKVLIEMGRYKESEEALNHSFSIFKKLDERTGMIMVNIELADALNRQGVHKALVLAKQTLAQAKNINNAALLASTYKKLSEIYAFNNDFKTAFNFQKLYKEIEDSLFNSEKERMLTEVEAKFQNEKKDNEIQYLTEKNKIQRNNNILLIVLMIVFAIMVLLLFFLLKTKLVALKRQKRVHEQENTINRQEKHIIQQEKQLLQEQLESKNRELASKALEMIRYNDAISGIIEKLEKLGYLLQNNNEARQTINDIVREIDSNTKQNIWDEFEKVFKNIHSGFYKNLIEVCPNISASEIKIAALLKLNLTTKEIAAITYKSEGGIKTTRYRLRQKLNLSSDEKLVLFLMQL